MNLGCQKHSERMTRVMMRRPGDSLLNADAQVWHYNEYFDAARAIEQYQGLVDIIEANGTEIEWIGDAGDGLADAMFTHDPSMVTNAGAILLSMGKDLRQGEIELHRRAYEQFGIPLLGRLEGDARIEGGDAIWLDAETLVIGLGFRSNRAGVDQLNAMLNPHGVKVLGFDLPVWQGEQYCLHLMSVISPLTQNLYLVHAPLIPTALWSLMRQSGIRLIEAPADEFEASLGLSLNVLPLSSRSCVMIDGFSATRAAIEAEGIEVHSFVGDALCIACEGGPTCLTNPLQWGP